MSLRPKPGIEKIAACPHGGPDYDELAALGLSPDDVLDFSVSTNPFLPPPGLMEHLREADVTRYPDSLSSGLRQQLAGRLGIPAAHILVGSGTTELIRLAALAYFGAGDEIIIPEPTYGEYAVACQVVGAVPLAYPCREADGFKPDIAGLVGLIKERRPRGVCLCNPNNPTGVYLSFEEVAALADSLEDGLLVLDEAYVAFIDPAWDASGLRVRDNVVVLRSMTKDYNLPGLRLGYAVAATGIIECLRRVCPPWNVNAVAQRAGLCLLDNENYLEESKIRVREAKKMLVDGFTRLGYSVLPSAANYFLVKVGGAATFRAALLRQGMQVRDCTSFGLPQYVRIAPRTLPEGRRLLEAVAALG